MLPGYQRVAEPLHEACAGARELTAIAPVRVEQQLRQHNDQREQQAGKQIHEQSSDIYELSGIYCLAAFLAVHSPTQSRKLWYQKTEFCGFNTQ
jgi:hypothetical protein